MTYGADQARLTAHLMEYLIHEASAEHRPGNITVRLRPDEGRLSVEFESGRLAALPRTPPSQYQPITWDTARAEIRPRDDGPDHTAWTWQAGPSHDAHLAERFTAELVRFVPPRVRFAETFRVSGGLNPLEHRATGVERPLNDAMTLVLVEEDAPGENDWLGHGGSRGVRPNIIYPMGISRYCGGIAHTGSWTGYHGSLEQDEVRAPARRVHLECRVVVHQRQNRNRLRYASTSGLNAETSELVRREARLMVQEWRDRETEAGRAASGATPLEGGPIIVNSTSPQAFGETMPTVARHPVALLIEPETSWWLGAAIQNALLAETELTPERSYQGRHGVEATLTAVTFQRDDGSAGAVDLRSGRVEGEKPVQGRGEQAHPERVQEIRATIKLTGDQYGGGCLREIQVPALVVACADGQPRMMITQAAAQQMNRTQVIRLLEDSGPGRHGNWAPAHADLALTTPETAFRRELSAILKRNPPIVGYPPETVTVRFGPNGMMGAEDQPGDDVP